MPVYRNRLAARLPRRHLHRVHARYAHRVRCADHRRERRVDRIGAEVARTRHDRRDFRDHGTAGLLRADRLCRISRHAGHRSGIHHHAQRAHGGIHLVRHHRVHELRMARPVLLRHRRMAGVARLPRRSAYRVAGGSRAVLQRHAHERRDGHHGGPLHASGVRAIPQYDRACSRSWDSTNTKALRTCDRPP